MAYKIGRQAARYSHHSLASDIFARLTLAVSSVFVFGTHVPVPRVMLGISRKILHSLAGLVP